MRHSMRFSRHSLLILLLGMLCINVCSAQTSPPSIDSARTLVKQGNDAAALSQLKQLIASDASQYQAWFLQGMIQTRQHQLDAAIASFQQVIQLQPKLAAPYNNLAVIYNESGDYHAAVNALETSLALNPNYMTAQENIGDLYVKLAADAYKQALKHDNNPILHQRYEYLLRIHQPTHIATPATTMHAATPILTNQQKLAAPHPQTLKPDMASSSPDITAALAVVEGWRAAWSKRDPDAYFATYSDQFTFPDRFDSRQSWMNYKRWAMHKRTYIKVELEHIQPTIISSNVIRVVFLQHFRSDSFNSDSSKEMTLEKNQGQWKISHEISR